MANKYWGFTERGDAGLDLSWMDYINAHKDDMYGATLITKNANKGFIQKVLELYHSGFTNLILHITCTGYGGTVMEPNVPAYTHQLDAIQNLVAAGFPAEQIVLRMDPLIPTKPFLDLSARMLNDFTSCNTGVKRVRLSVYDEYRHVKERLRAAGYAPFYGTSFYAPPEMKADIVRFLKQYPQFEFETCAEDWLANQVPNLTACGCISAKDFAITRQAAPATGENIQNRNGCHCLACKREMLKHRGRCPHKCLYCYWQD